MKVRLWRVICLIVLTFLAQGCRQMADKEDVVSGWRAYQDGQWATAEALLGPRTRDWAAQMAAGISAYRQHRFSRAMDYFRHAAWWASTDMQRAQALMNLANVLFRMQQFTRSVETYEEVLRYDPDNQDARHNLVLARNALAYAEARRQLRQRQVSLEGPVPDAALRQMMKRSTGRHLPGSVMRAQARKAAEVVQGGQAPGAQSGRHAADQALEQAARMSPVVQRQRAEMLRLQLRQLDRRVWEIQQRLFEREEGFEAVQKTPQRIKGVLPW